MLKTDPIEITVAKKSASNTQNVPVLTTDNTALATLSLLPAKTEIYEGESVIATLYFRYRRDADIAKSEYKRPDFDGFLTKEVGKVKEYRDGEYNVKELNYALIPLKSGKIDVVPAKIRYALYLQRNSNDMLDMFFKRAVTKSVASSPFSIKCEASARKF